MSAQSTQLDSEASSQSSDSGPEGSDLSQVSRKPKQKNDQCRAWNFQYTLQSDLLGEEGVTTHEKLNLLTEHLQTRLGHRKPRSVHSVTVFCDFKYALLPLTDVSPLIPIPIIGYVQSRNCTVYAMTQWLPDAAWAPVPGGLADHPDFLRYMSLVENTAGPWFKLSVFGELGLNNAGRRAARENRKVFLKPFIHFLARPSD